TGRDGFQIQQSDGSYLMRSPFTPGDPSALVPANAAAYWNAAVGVMEAGGLPAQTAAYLRQIAPLAAQAVGTSFLDASTGDIVSAPPFARVDPIRESTTTSVEGGYRGVIANRLLLAADIWWARKNNLVTPLTPVTPLVLLDGTTTVQFLVPRLMQDLGYTQEQATAAALQLAGSAAAPGLATIPVGVVSSADINANGPQLLTTYYNVDDELDYYGLDLSANFLLSDAFSLAGTLSLVNDNVFETDRGESITLNAPKTKASVSGTYRHLGTGLSTEQRVRYSDEIPVRSGMYKGTRSIEPALPGTEDCVDEYTLLDLTASYAIPT